MVVLTLILIRNHLLVGDRGPQQRKMDLPRLVSFPVVARVRTRAWNIAAHTSRNSGFGRSGRCTLHQPHQGRIADRGRSGDQRLSRLAAIPVERHGLESEPPSLNMQLFELFDADLPRKIHRLGDRSTDKEGWAELPSS